MVSRSALSAALIATNADYRGVLQRVTAGETDAGIAVGEHISERTVRRRIREMMDCLAVNSRAELAAEAVRRDLI
jgi:DNA-binding NarL/FixJ family response regulator